MSVKGKCIRVLLILFVFFLSVCPGKVWNILDEGAIPNDQSIATCNNNTQILNNLLQHQAQRGDTVLIPAPHPFWFNGGISGSLHDIIIQIDGSIHYQNQRKYWPTHNDSDRVLEAMSFINCNNVTFTSSNKLDKGLIDGHGNAWWGAIQYCVHRENRPRLLYMHNSSNILIEYIYFKDSPYWTTYLSDVKNVEIHHSNVSARLGKKDHHDLFDLTAFNTDGFDVSGDNVWIHDVEIWNDDDCIAVKPLSRVGQQAQCSQNMLFERINASGIGLTIGSVGANSNHNCVRNITFRNAYMYHTWKGIYVKSAPGSGTGSISDVLYENITMDGPTGWSIWIGPQQAGYHDQCSLTWPRNPFANCPVNPNVSVENITLRNVLINSPKESPGVILGNDTNPMQNIVFDNVVVTNPGSRPWGKQYYKCEGVRNFTAIHGTDPAPTCPTNAHQLLEFDYTKLPGYEKVEELMECLADHDKRDVHRHHSRADGDDIAYIVRDEHFSMETSEKQIFAQFLDPLDHAAWTAFSATLVVCSVCLAIVAVTGCRWCQKRRAKHTANASLHTILLQR